MSVDIDIGSDYVFSVVVRFDRYQKKLHEQSAAHWLASQKCASCYVRVKSHLVRSDPTQVKCVSVQEPRMWGPLRVWPFVLGHPC